LSLAKKYRVEMPLCEQIHRVLFEVVLPPSLVHVRCNQTVLIYRIPRHGPEVEAQPEP